MNAPYTQHLTQVDDTQIAQENDVIKAAKEILDRRIYSRGPTLDSPETVANYLKLQLAQEEHEVFAAVFVDSKLRVLAFEVLFTGTIDSAVVYQRQLIKRAMFHNAAGIVLSHNHPSGCTRPSRQDIELTKQIITTLNILDIRLVDHLIVGKGESFSMTEEGLI